MTTKKNEKKDKVHDGFIATVYDGDKKIAKYDTFVISGHTYGENITKYQSTVSMQNNLVECMAMLASMSDTLIGLIRDVGAKYKIPSSKVVDLIKIASILQSTKSTNVKYKPFQMEDDPTVPENMKSNLWKIKEGNG